MGIQCYISLAEETIPQIFTCSPDSDSEEEIGTFKWFLDGVEVKPAAEGKYILKTNLYKNDLK